MTTHIGQPRALTLLVEYFGVERGEFLLWNHTCFPMDDSRAETQAQALIAADRAGTLEAYLDQQMDQIVKEEGYENQAGSADRARPANLGPGRANRPTY